MNAEPNRLAHLHQDHVNLAQLVPVLRAGLSKLQSGERADLELLEEIMIYVTQYPDRIHHPTEDIIFTRLLDKAPELRNELTGIMEEHDDLVRAGRKFLSLLRAAEEDAPVPRPQIVADGERYVDMLVEHMNTEESQLFPAAARTLHSEDWDWVESQALALEDSHVFANLRSRIEAHTAAS